MKTIQSKLANGTDSSTWDQMIEDAKKRIRKLEISIRVFTQKKEAGEPFPLVGGNK